jgi:hypothetical protein
LGTYLEGLVGGEGGVLALEIEERGDERLGDVLAAVRAESAGGVGALDLLDGLLGRIHDGGANDGVAARDGHGGAAGLLRARAADGDARGQGLGSGHGGGHGCYRGELLAR